MTYQIKRDSQIINLGVGQPDPALLPITLFQNLSIQAEDLAYGKEQGDDEFRELLSQWLALDYQYPINPDSLFVTNGSSNALDMICTHFSKPGDTVFVEDPSYFIALELFACHGLKVKAIPMGHEGIDLDALESALKTERPAFLYCVPSFHNPTGVTIPEQNRKRLIELAKQHDLMIAADEVYQSLYFQSPPPVPLACYDSDAPIISIGSFSKILAPGLRLGWMQTNKKVIKILSDSALFKSGGGLSPVTSATLRPILAKGQMQSYIESLRQEYNHRLNTLSDALQQHCEHLEFSKPTGGYFIWAQINGSTPAHELLKSSKEKGVAFTPGKFFSSISTHQFYARLCFAFYPVDQLVEGAKRLGTVLRR